VANEGDTWAATGVRLEDFERLHAEGDLLEVACVACGYPTLTERDGHHICVVCHWQDDGSTREQPDRPSKANQGITLRQAAAHIAETGVYASRWHALDAPAYFLPNVRAARDELVQAYERLRVDPDDSSAHTDIRAGRAKLMRAIVNEMR
jgi:uncharacterized Zn finger protein (UPF0148 family)